MGRAIYPHELGDPDYAWLMNSFKENNPDCVLVEATTLPMVFIRDEKKAPQTELVALGALSQQQTSLNPKDKPVLE